MIVRRDRRGRLLTRDLGPGYAEIPDRGLRELVAWWAATRAEWQGADGDDAEAFAPAPWLAALPARAPHLGEVPPGWPPPTWARGADIRLYPVRRADVVALIVALAGCLPDASNRGIARLIGCSHSTVAAHRKAVALAGAGA